MARLTYTGVEELNNKISALGENAEAIAKAGLFAGAGAVADALRQAVNTIPVDTDETHPFSDPLYVITQDDREDLANAVGIAHFETAKGKVTTSISFNGYARRTEKKFPNGVPLPMIARSIESGSSVRKKYPFVRRTANRVRQAAQEATVNGADAKIHEIVEEVDNG